MMLDLGYANAFQGNIELVRGTLVALARLSDGLTINNQRVL